MFDLYDLNCACDGDEIIGCNVCSETINATIDNRYCDGDTCPFCNEGILERV